MQTLMQLLSHIYNPKNLMKIQLISILTDNTHTPQLLIIAQTIRMTKLNIQQQNSSDVSHLTNISHSTTLFQQLTILFFSNC